MTDSYYDQLAQIFLLKLSGSQKKEAKIRKLEVDFTVADMKQME